ncbi:FtsX-like permease family protein, partial [Streptomyces atriruber]|uniref:FtsX-like permease family protein n=1 Tax=Streptomyces atriruber TaxID=545121 RepID=UPI0012FF41ED
MRRRRWPAAVRGSRRHGLVLGAAGLAVLLAATVLAALAALSEKAVEGGVQRRLAADREAVVEVAGSRRARGTAELDAAVRAALDRTYGDVPHRTWSALRAPAARNDELAVTEAAGHPREDATVSVVALQGTARHGVLAAGRWPRPGGRAVEVALTETAAAELAVRTGDGITVRGAAGRPVPMRVVGTYAAEGRAPAVWATLSSAFGTPDSIAVVSRDAFTGSKGLAGDATELWLGVPDTGGLRLGDIDALQERAKRFAGSDAARSVLRGEGNGQTEDNGRAEGNGQAGGDVADKSELTLSAGLRRALGRLTTPIAVARAGLYVPAVLLAALAVAALVLTARQLAEHRRPELVLLAARGAGTRRIALSAAAQWACVAVPAGLAAPFLAGPLLHALEASGLIESDVPATAATAQGWTAVLAALLVHGLAVLLPTVRTVRDRRAVDRPRRRITRFAGALGAVPGRELAGGALGRFGADLALAAVAVLGWLQLRQYESPVTGDSGVDPVLVLVPVTMTVAAALLVLRLLPLLARLVDPLALRGRGLVLPLGGWQVGRRAARHAGPALVVTLALAVAALSSTALAVLDRGDRDQAVFRVGADLRVEPGEGVPPGERRAAYEALPGAESVTPVVTSEGYVGQDAVAVTAIDTRRGPAPALRRDLADRPVGELVAPLGEKVPDHGLPVGRAGRGPGTELPLRVRLSADGRGPVVPVRLTVFFEDGDGLTRSGSVSIKEGGTRTIPLKVGARGADVRILQIDLSMVGERVRRTYRLTVDRVPGLARQARWRDLRTDPPDRRTAGCPGAEREKPGAPGTDVAPGSGRRSPSSSKAPGPVLCSDRPGSGKLIDAVLRGPDGDLKYPTWSVRLGTDRAKGRPAAPALADDALLRSGAVRVGDTVTVRRSTGGSARVEIVGRIAAVPGVPRDRPRLLADSRAMAAQWAMSGSLAGAESAWWVG